MFNQLTPFHRVPSSPLQNRYTKKHNGEIIKMMNDKLNLLIEQEVGDDVGQILPDIEGNNWQMPPSIEHLQM
jgi:hypothetical protein